MLDIFSPILIDGATADNDPQKYFIGGVILQRPSLTQIGSVVYGAFGGHCDLFNYTGLVMGIDINKGKIITNWAVESGPLVPQTNVLLQGGGGGEGGIWMSGMGLATDGARVFTVSGNGGVSMLVPRRHCIVLTILGSSKPRNPSFRLQRMSNPRRSDY